MQSSPENHAESTPVASKAAEHQQDTEAQPMQSKPDEQEGEDRPDAPAQTTTTAEAASSVAPGPPLEKEPVAVSQAESWKNGEKTNTDPTAKASAPPEPAADGNTNPGSDGQKVKKQSKGTSDRRKYVPSKKAMVDPLKMDMSKPVVMPLTCKYISFIYIKCPPSWTLKTLRPFLNPTLLKS